MNDTIEPAVSGRAKCGACRRTLAKGELRFGERIVIGHDGNDDVTVTTWYHLACAAAKCPDKLRPVLAATKTKIPERAALDAALGGSPEMAGLEKMTSIARSPTSRANCQQCRRKIEKTTLRVAVLLDMELRISGYVHLACARAYVDSNVTQYLTVKSKTLPKADRDEVVAMLGALAALDGDPRGRELEAAAAAVFGPRKKSTGKLPAEMSVLSDWLEDRGFAIPSLELAELVKCRNTKKR